MNPRSSLCQLLVLILKTSAASASIVLASAALAAGPAIVVTADGYVLDGKTYEDPESLASALPAREGEVLALEACMPGSTDSLTAVVQRFADRSLQISVVDASAPACVTAAAPMIAVAHRTIDDAAARRYWQDLAP